jgi:acetyl esterase/lipase
MRENEGSIQGRVMRDVIAHVTGDFLIGKKIKNGELRKSIGNNEPPWKCPDCFTMKVIETEQFKMELLELKEKPRRDKIILQLHGGGYVGAMRNAYRMFAGLYNEVSQGMSVLTPDYRVAPEDPFPAALKDAYVAYNYLLDQGWFSEQIILAGDSAGGGLAMALCHYLKDRGRQLPCGIVAMSPWTDLTASGESYDTNYAKDPLFGKTRDSLIYNRDYVGEHDPMDAYISPLFGDFREFPPMLIQVGSYEMLLSDSVSVAAKAREQGVKVRLSVYDGMFHIFQMAAKMLPESKKAWVEIGKFINVLTND